MTARDVTSPESVGNESRYSRCIIAGLILVCVAIYGRTLTHDFISYDDPSYITQNHLIKQGFSPEGLRSAFTTPHSYNWHPLTTLSHMLDCQLFGSEQAAGHHAVNLVLHTASVVVLFFVLRQMSGSVWPSALVAALFAVHPLGVESIAWVSERKNILSTLLWFVTMAAYVRYVRRSTVGNYLLVAISMTLGMMSKQMLVTLPCTLLLLDYWPLGRIQFGEKPSRNEKQSSKTAWALVIEKIPLFAISVLGSALVLWAQGHTQISLDRLPLAARIENSLITYVAYLGKFLWPIGLIVYYPLRTANLSPDEMVSGLFPAAALSGVVLLVIFAVCIRQRLKRPYLIVGWLWYLGTLVPVIGIVQVGHQSMADRYTYIPLVGIHIMLAWLAAEFVKKHAAARTWIVSAVAVWLVVLGAAAFKQVGYWQDSKTLFTYVLNVNEDNAIAQHAIAESLYDEGEYEQAEYHIKRAIELRPSEPRPYVSLGYVYYRQRIFGPALENFNRGISIHPRHAFAFNGRGLVYLSVGQFDKAKADLERALELEPYSEIVQHNMQLALGQSALQAGDLATAESHFQQAVLLNDEESSSRVFLGMIAAAGGRTTEALKFYRQALALEPDSIEANINLANLLITAPEPALRNASEAIRFAERACRETEFNRPDLLNTLAAAYFTAGRIPDALQVVQRALELPNLPPALQKQLLQNLELFEASSGTAKPR